MKVWCVFEEVNHANRDDKDLDGVSLVAIYKDDDKDSGQDKARRKMQSLLSKHDWDPEKDDLETENWCIRLTERNAEDSRNIDCRWFWHIREVEVL